MNLDNQVAIVTGASRGIGRGIALALASYGASVELAGRDTSALKETAALIRQSGRKAISVRGDVGLRSTADRLVERACDVFGGVDILVNNAAWALPRAHFLDLDERHWDQVMRTNLKSVYMCSQAAARSMVRSKRKGVIINISSFGAVRAHRHMAAYDAAKGAIESLTRVMAIDLAPFGIRVNAVSPGTIATETTTPKDPEAARLRAAQVPLGRLGTPREVGEAVCFLASTAADYITGQCLYIDGGMLAQLRPPSLDLQPPRHWASPRFEAAPNDEE